MKGNKTTSEETTSSYRNIFKATSLFGGVQLYQIAIGIIRSKLIAIILGPEGMGFAGLYTSATALVNSLSSMGLKSSAIKDVSEANSTGDQERIDLTISVLKKLVWISGVLGMVIVLGGSPFLSFCTFGSYDYIIPFALLSITLLIDQLAVGQNVILQGTRRLRYLAKSSTIGSTIGLFTTIPIYYVWGLDGIVPALIIASFTSYLLALYFANKVPFNMIKVSIRDAISKGGSMLKMGLAMSFNGLLVTGSGYLLRIFISHHGGTEAVGLYTAGFAIVTTYVGMIFTAISTDYYPRLSAVNHDNNKCRELINQEGEMGTLILAPCLIVCIIFMPIIIRILYTKEFDLSADYILWACVGMMFKLFSWVIGFIFIAKSAMKVFLANETAAMVYNLFFSIVGYYLYGLRGLGIAFTIGYIIYAIQVLIVAHIKYKYCPSQGFWIVFLFQLLLVFVSLLSTLIPNCSLSWLIGSIMILISAIYSFGGLNKRMDFVSSIKNKNKK